MLTGDTTLRLPQGQTQPKSKHMMMRTPQTTTRATRPRQNDTQANDDTVYELKKPRWTTQTPSTVRINTQPKLAPTPTATSVPNTTRQAQLQAPVVPATPTITATVKTTDTFYTPAQAREQRPTPKQQTPKQQTPKQQDTFQRPQTFRPPKPIVESHAARDGGFDFDKPATTIVVQGKIYQKLDRIGKGGSCNVYKVISQDRKISALKEVDLTSADEATVESYENEIRLLANLQGSPYIIKMIGWEINRSKGYIHIVMQCGDADLNTILKNRKKAGKQIDENYLRLYWQQMLEAVHIVHQAQVIHSDLKPANFLFVEGALKLIDFGIATQVQDDMTSAIRGSAVGTLNYMAPESIQNQSSGNTLQTKAQDFLKIGPAADVWSLGCILYLMAHGKTPFQHLNPLQKLQAIVNRDHKIDFPKSNIRGLTEILQRCFERDPKRRPTIPELLAHKFLKPNAPPTPRTNKTPKRGGISQQQLYAILKQLPLGGGVPESPGVLARRVFSQLNSGGDITNFLDAASPMMPIRKFSTSTGKRVAWFDEVLWLIVLVYTSYHRLNVHGNLLHDLVQRTYTTAHIYIYIYIYIHICLRFCGCSCQSTCCLSCFLIWTSFCLVLLYGRLNPTQPATTTANHAGYSERCPFEHGRSKGTT